MPLIFCNHILLTRGASSESKLKSHIIFSLHRDTTHPPPHRLDDWIHQGMSKVHETKQRDLIFKNSLENDV